MHVRWPARRTRPRQDRAAKQGRLTSLAPQFNSLNIPLAGDVLREIVIQSQLGNRNEHRLFSRSKLHPAGDAFVFLKPFFSDEIAIDLDGLASFWRDPVAGKLPNFSFESLVKFIFGIGRGDIDFGSHDAKFNGADRIVGEICPFGKLDVEPI